MRLIGFLLPASAGTSLHLRKQVREWHQVLYQFGAYTDCFGIGPFLIDN